ncbi:Hypothetical protein CRIB_495 [Romboutsia ilealis]|uniref:Uncharacterized protein n=1 Tax=Romboutsia ilealis TaxID=1115758 RepID=A0A1V1HZ54_9FIRM|nr:hypothetical protein [Romboutsia ilealis]CED93250.1 Hypothetical protein CRIB_495 [Romboutsia ilealis]
MKNMYSQRTKENYETTQQLQELNGKTLTLDTPHLKIQDDVWLNKFDFYVDLLTISDLLSDLDLGVLGNLVSTEVLLERLQKELLNPELDLVEQSKIINSYQKLLSSYNTLCSTVGLGIKNRGQILKNKEQKVEEQNDELLKLLRD